MKNGRIILVLAFVALAALLMGCPTESTGSVATPVFSPEGGVYNGAQMVTITCSTDDAVIYYTTDGSTPTKNSPRYTDPIEVSGDGTTMVINALAVCEGMKDSSNTSAYSIYYTIFPRITGSIITAEGVNIENVKVGLFFKGAALGPNPTVNLNLNDDIDNTAPDGRVYYNDSALDAGTSVSLTPTRLGVIDPTAKTYNLNIPMTPPARSGGDWSEGYYALAWYDTDEDGNLDLMNGPATTYADQGEYNRMPVKSITIGGVDDTPCYIDFIEQNQLDADSYQFKYYKVGDKDTYEHQAFTEADLDGFNFTIDAAVDTN